MRQGLPLRLEFLEEHCHSQFGFLDKYKGGARRTLCPRLPVVRLAVVLCAVCPRTSKACCSDVMAVDELERMLSADDMTGAPVFMNIEDLRGSGSGYWLAAVYLVSQSSSRLAQSFTSHQAGQCDMVRARASGINAQHHTHKPSRAHNTVSHRLAGIRGKL